MRIAFALAAVSTLCAVWCGGCRIEEPRAVPTVTSTSMPRIAAPLQRRPLETGRVPGFGGGSDRALGPASLETQASTDPRDDDWRMLDRPTEDVASSLRLSADWREYAVQSGERARPATSRGFAIPLGRWRALGIWVDHRKFEIGIDGVTRIEVFHTLVPEFGGLSVWANEDIPTSSLDDVPELPDPPDEWIDG